MRAPPARPCRARPADADWARDLVRSGSALRRVGRRRWAPARAPAGTPARAAAAQSPCPSQRMRFGVEDGALGQRVVAREQQIEVLHGLGEEVTLHAIHLLLGAHAGPRAGGLLGPAAGFQLANRGPSHLA